MRIKVSFVTHVPFVIVQINVALLFAFKPLTVVVDTVGDVIVAPLLTPKKLHAPVPMAAVLAVIIKLPFAHWFLSTPALAIVTALCVIITLSLDEHEPFVTVHLRVALVPEGTAVMVVL